MDLLDYWKAITQTKENIIEYSFSEMDYDSFSMNRSLSYFIDFAPIANDMNHFSHLDNKLQFDYFINTIEKYTGKEKRYLKSWVKPTEIENLELVKEYYNYGNIRAKEALELLTDDHLLYIKHKLRKGGMNK